MMTSGGLTPDERYAAGLAALGAGPVRTRRFLDGYEPAAAWSALANGCHHADPDHAYQSKALPLLLDKVETACGDNGIAVLIYGRPGYPPALLPDHEAPGVLFSLGDPSVMDTRARVVMVGTRSATPYGLSVAAELGRGLTEAGVVVVAGMARGIATAAHAGALVPAAGAPPVAIIGSALDTTAHGSEAQLRRAVAERGAVLSERAPASTGTPVWCFAVRNRMMAAVADVVVVVECHRQGASLQTVKAAVDRGVAVMAVPGSVRSSASTGCNALLVDGVAPARDVHDVLALVELVIAGRSGITGPRLPGPRASDRPPAARAPNPLAERTLQALDHDPASLDTVVRRTGMTLADVAQALEQLAAVDLAVGAGGWWSRPSR
jgi:DNA processing protein